jgi:peptide/nickel transport system permease protein
VSGVLAEVELARGPAWEDGAEPVRRATGRSRLTLAFGAAILGAVIVATLAVRLFGIGSPNTPNYSETLLAPSWHHPFGTDALGRDVFIRCVYAAWIDLRLAVVCTVTPLALGLVIGGLAGYLGGVIGAAINRAMEFLQAFPSLVLIMVVVGIAGPGMATIFIALVLANLPAYARLTRGEMLVLREQQFMLAAQTLGFSRRRVMFRHGLPHLLRPGFIFSLSQVIFNMLVLAALSFLGLGVEPPTPEWGAIIADGQTYLLTNWWIATLPGIFLVVVALGFSLIGEALADRLRSYVTGRA